MSFQITTPTGQVVTVDTHVGDGFTVVEVHITDPQPETPMEASE